MEFRPIIIIGAARSGTNALRDSLVRFPGIATWPCDEINYVWRRGNARWPDDEIPPDRAVPEAQRYIRRSFDWVARTRQACIVVEKTCANTLRVPFVERILPDARYIYIVRDGRDVTASAAKRWTASLDLPYLFAKARFVPAADLPYYACRYLANRVHRHLSPDRRLAFWGPRFCGMDKEIQNGRSVLELCALQWAHSVDQADAAFTGFSHDRVFRVRYEEFVRMPKQILADLADFLGIDVVDQQVEMAAAGITRASVGKGLCEFDDDARTKIDEFLRDPLRRHGYV